LALSSDTGKVIKKNLKAQYKPADFVKKMAKILLLQANKGKITCFYIG
jgi:hypothetical protein